MNVQSGINYYNEDDNMNEVMLDGNEDLEASLSCVESGYPMYNIKVERGFYTIFELKRKYDSDEKRIILDSDFQRESVWKPKQKAELVESILMGQPLPIFYFNQDKMGRLIVVDGRQRLTALFEFMSNKWPLKDLKVLDELNGKKFDDLDPVVQAQIEDYQLQAHVIQPPTPDRIKFDIFDRVNRAGTQLNKQEIRNALYQGKSTKLLNKVVATEEFSRATGNAFQRNARMKDKYLVLRFLAFEFYFSKKIYKGEDIYIYKSDIDELLGLAMEYINDLSEEEVQLLYGSTIDALINSYEILGGDAFRMIRKDGSRSPINMNVFEVLMHLMTKFSKKDYKYKLEICESVFKMKNSIIFQDAVGNHRDNVIKDKTRYEMVEKIVEEINDRKTYS